MMNTPTAAVRYFTVPQDINITPGIGMIRAPMRGETEQRDGGPLSFADFFMTGILGAIASTGNDDAEEFLGDRLRKCVAGQRIEIPEAHFKILLDALPTALASKAPEVYWEMRPLFSAVRRAPTSKPDGWDAAPLSVAAE